MMNGRRRLLKGMATAGAALALGLKSSPARANPMLVVTVASAALSVAKMFSASGNGLGALLKAQLQLTNLVLDKLQELQVQINNVSTQIGKLESSLRERFAAQFRDELLQEIAGAVALYRSRVRASLSNPSLLTTTQAQEDLKQILYRTAFNRSTLLNMSNGIGAEVALVLPVMMGVEIACMAHLNYDKAFILATVNDYESLIERMRGNEPGSIPQQISDAIRRHDDALNIVSGSGLGRRLAIENYKITGTQKGQDAVFCDVPFPMRAVPSQVQARYLKGKVGWTYWGDLSLADIPNDLAGVKLAELRKIEAVISKTESSSIYLNDDQMCTIHEVPKLVNGSMSREEVRSWARTVQPELKQEDAIVAALSAANYERSLIGMYLSAQVVLSNVERQITAFRTVLPGGDDAIAS